MINDYETIKISDKPIVKIAASFNNRLWIAIGNEVIIYEASNELKYIVSFIPNDISNIYY